MATTHGARMVFDNARALISNAGYNVNQAVLSQSYLRSEIAMSTTSTNYHVPVLVNDTQNGAAFSTEQRLQLQDVFVISQVGLFVSIPGSATATNFKLYSYPNGVAFSGANTADSLYSLYNGYLQFVINNRQIGVAWDLYRHLAVPQTQEDTQAGGNTGIDQISGADTGYYPMEPNICLSGAKNNQLSLVLPSALQAVEANSRIVVIFRGILAQNVTPVR